MSWAARRRFLILLIVGGVIAAFLMVVSIATFYKTPSCTDSIKNQDEEGIDCSGSCPYLCSAQQQEPKVLFTLPLTNTEGRTDVIASVANKNTSTAAKNVSYRVQLYGTDQTLVQEVSGALDLPPGATVPVFIPGVISGKQTVASAFLTIDTSSLHWFSLSTDPRILPRVSNPNPGGTAEMPRIEAVLTNPSVAVLTNVRAIVLVRNGRGDVIAASSTIVPTIPGQGQATAVFTWNSKFPDTPSVIEIVPIIPLP